MAFFQSESLWVNQLAGGVAELVLDAPGRKVNVLGARVFDDLEAAMDKVAAASLRTLIIRSGKPDHFCAGADVHELEGNPNAEQLIARAERGQQVFAKLAALPIPTVAIIAGACLGGGLELALACDYRVVVDKPSAQLGLPEVELGVIPAWGGTQRLPRLIGLERALNLIVGVRRLGARDAYDWGLADQIIDSADANLADFLANAQKRQWTEPRRTWRQRFLESNRFGRWLLFRGARRLLTRRIPDDMPAPWEALEAVRTGLRRGFDAGLAFEREALARLADTPACRNLIRLFLAREQARRPSEKKRERSRPLRRIGIVGAGTMGLGLAHLAVLRGFEVVLREASEIPLGYAVLRVLNQLEQSVKRGQLSAEDFARKLGAVHGTTAWKGFDSVDLVIEAVEEDLAKKQALFREMERHVPATAILTSATSSLSIEALQAGSSQPGRIAGMHFFFPVAKIPLVEVAVTPATDADVAEDLKDWSRKLGRTALVVKDSPGFVVHRMLMPYFNEAVLLLAEGVRAERIDEAMERFGMPQGPLEHLDEIGLDEAAALVKALQPVVGARIPLTPVFEMMLEQGWNGLKSGLGFYRYRKGRRKHHAAPARLLSSLEHARYWEALSREEQIEQVQERLTAIVVNEAAYCLDEGLADEQTLDLAMVLAGAWAPHRGGPLRHAFDRGAEEVIASLEQLTERFGPRFAPAPRLRRLALPVPS